MVLEEVQEAVGIQAAGIAVGNALRIVAAQHIDAPVQKLQQAFVADFHAEASRVAVACLPQGQILILSVAQDIVCPQAVQRHASCLSGEHRSEAVFA